MKLPSPALIKDVPIARLLQLHEQLFGPLDPMAKTRMLLLCRQPGGAAHWRGQDGPAA